MNKFIKNIFLTQFFIFSTTIIIAIEEEFNHEKDHYVENIDTPKQRELNTQEDIAAQKHKEEIKTEKTNNPVKTVKSKKSETVTQIDLTGPSQKTSDKKQEKITNSDKKKAATDSSKNKQKSKTILTAQDNLSNDFDSAFDSSQQETPLQKKIGITDNHRNKKSELEKLSTNKMDKLEASHKNTLLKLNKELELANSIEQRGLKPRLVDGIPQTPEYFEEKISSENKSFENASKQLDYEKQALLDSLEKNTNSQLSKIKNDELSLSKKLKNATPKDISAAVNKVSTTIALSKTQATTFEGILNDSESGTLLDKDTVVEKLNLTDTQIDSINKEQIKSSTKSKSLYDSILEFLKNLFSTNKTNLNNK